MSWDTTLPIMVRSAIGDTADPPKYSDDALAPVILTAAYITANSVLSVATTYNIDVENSSLVPDPTDALTSDGGFVYLITLKAAVMLLYAEVRKYGQQAIAIRDGTSAIDLKRDLKALKELADSYAKELQTAIAQSVRNASSLSGRMVVSPYRGLINCVDDYFYDRRSCRY